MEENEKIRQYHARISNISNESFILGKKDPIRKTNTKGAKNIARKVFL